MEHDAKRSAVEACEYLINKYCRDVKNVKLLPLSEKQEARTIPRFLVSQEEHDKILAAWKSEKVTIVALAKRFRRSEYCVHTIIHGRHVLSPRTHDKKNDKGRH
jgi:hypothetical protein